MISVDSNDARPIWRQIEEALRDLITAGRFEVDAPVPSVRDLAREAQVNPATVAKAYRALTAGGFLEVRRGEGTFVSSTAPRSSVRHRRRQLRRTARKLIDLASELDTGAEELHKLIAELWKELDHGSDTDTA